MMNREEFVDYAVTLLSNNLPNVLLKQDENDALSLNMYAQGMEEGETRKISLVNAWNNYYRTGHVEVIHTFVKGVIEFASKSKDEQVNQRIEDLIPVVRPEGFSTKKTENHGEVYFIHDGVTEGIEICYAFDGQHAILFAMPDLLPDGYDEEQGKNKAKQNLIQRGWFESTDKDSMPYGTILFYDNDRQPINAQFLLPEMYEKKIGTSFYVAFPNYDVAVVLKMHGYIKSLEREKKKALAAFSLAIQHMYMRLKSPLVPFVYQMENGKLSKVDF